MAPKSISLFMWGYQPHFRNMFESLMKEVLSFLGASEPGAECFLVGAKIPGHQNRNDVCVEPEDGKWNPDLFDGLLDLIEEEISSHPLQNIIYSDEPSRRDKPERIHRESVRLAVQKMLDSYDSANAVRSLAGPPAPVDDHYVVPVLQLPEMLFQRFTPLQEPITFNNFTGHPSLIHAAMSEVLTEAYDELLRPDPGRYLSARTKSQEIVQRAATSFMYTLGRVIEDRNFWSFDLFERFNLISSLMYEGTKGTGKLILANPDSGAVNLKIRFSKPVPFHEPRWCRKALQMASPNTSLIADCEKIHGLGTMAAGVDPWISQSAFEIEFLDHYSWHLSCGDRILFISNYGVPSLPKERVPEHRLLDTYQRLFPQSKQLDVNRFMSLFDAAINQRHGSILIVAEDAESEANRLREQGTKIEPTVLTPDLYRQVSGVDGAVIIDPTGVCHAIGVILDGAASPKCTPSRGARYNSGIRYIDSSNIPRLAVIVSDDRMVDVIPILRQRINRSELEQAISQLETADSDNYHSAARWLDGHRFYLDQQQCDRINSSLKRIGDEPMEVGEIRKQWQEFTPDPDMDDGYFECEDP